jgi:hypothetical protein
MSTRDEFFKKLNDSPLYKVAREGFKTNAEKKKLDSFMFEQFGGIAEVLSNIISKTESDPNFREELRLALDNREQVVINEATTQISGSSSE